MKVVVTTKDFCEEAKRYLESEGFEVALRNRLGIGAGAPDDVLYPVVEDADAIIAGTETYRPELLARLRNLSSLFAATASATTRSTLMHFAKKASG